MSAQRSNQKQEAIKDLLPRLRKQLEEEYEDLPEGKAHAVAKQALDELAEARVRDFVPIMAWRRARANLRRAS